MAVTVVVFDVGDADFATVVELSRTVPVIVALVAEWSTPSRELLPVLATAVRSSHLGLFAAAIALGFVIGVFGHIIRSRTLIITGILVIGLVSAYYVFALQPTG